MFPLIFQGISQPNQHEECSARNFCIVIFSEQSAGIINGGSHSQTVLTSGMFGTEGFQGAAQWGPLDLSGVYGCFAYRGLKEAAQWGPLIYYGFKEAFNGASLIYQGLKSVLRTEGFKQALNGASSIYQRFKEVFNGAPSIYQGLKVVCGPSWLSVSHSDSRCMLSQSSSYCFRYNSICSDDNGKYYGCIFQTC